MPHFFSVSTGVINTIPVDLDHNVSLIKKCIAEAAQQNADLLLLPELCISGYGCEDLFYVQSFLESIPSCLPQIMKVIPEGMLVAAGLPIWYEGQIYNACALLSRDRILGLTCKQYLARTGIHYEHRWFAPWPRGKARILENWIEGYDRPIPLGDVFYQVDGVRIGFEICEDSWVAHRPGNELYTRNVDIILNPSASHFSIGKQESRRNFVKDGSRAYCCVYAYTNLLGNEAGRAIYDGDSMIASNGRIVMHSDRLSFKECATYNAVVDLDENRNNRIISSETILTEDLNRIVDNEFSFRPVEDPAVAACETDTEIEEYVICRAVALGLWDFMRKTKTGGFALSLSGGADSALCACMIYYAQVQAIYSLGHQNYLKVLSASRLNPAPYDEEKYKNYQEYIRREVMPLVLITLYQGSKHSGQVTFNAAQKLAECIGAKHYSWSISDLVAGYEKLVNDILPEDQKLCWERDDLTLQNIQARVRSPGIWMLANKFNKLLVATSNLSEASVGYCTMDGDTSGVISPIGGISKSKILKINRFIMNEGLKLQDSADRCTITDISYVVNQQPTAELRPVEQTDENDLMPYPLLDEIRRLSQTLNLMPKDVLIHLTRGQFARTFSFEQLKAFVIKYYRLYCRNQWKRERLAVGFHIEQDSADPKTFRRFPVLSNQFEKQLEEIRNMENIKY